MRNENENTLILLYFGSISYQLQIYLFILVFGVRVNGGNGEENAAK